MTTTTTPLIAAIEKAAIAKWGDNWFPRLVAAYCMIESAETGKPVPTPNRRGHIERIMNGEVCPTIATFEQLCRCLDIKISLTQTQVKEESLL